MPFDILEQIAQAQQILSDPTTSMNVPNLRTTSRQDLNRMIAQSVTEGRRRSAAATTLDTLGSVYKQQLMDQRAAEKDQATAQRYAETARASAQKKIFDDASKAIRNEEIRTIPELLKFTGTNLPTPMMDSLVSIMGGKQRQYQEVYKFNEGRAKALNEDPTLNALRGSAQRTAAHRGRYADSNQFYNLAQNAQDQYNAMAEFINTELSKQKSPIIPVGDKYFNSAPPPTGTGALEWLLDQAAQGGQGVPSGAIPQQFPMGAPQGRMAAPPTAQSSGPAPIGPVISPQYLQPLNSPSQSQAGRMDVETEINRLSNLINNIPVDPNGNVVQEKVPEYLQLKAAYDRLMNRRNGMDVPDAESRHAFSFSGGLGQTPRATDRRTPNIRKFFNLKTGRIENRP